DITPLYFELDGTFPNPEANPLEPKNLVDLQVAVQKHGADIGLAFDGDADRCFVVDERGDPVSPSAITALVAARELAKHPGGTIIHNLITSAAVPEIVREHGGQPLRSRVGHSYIKAEMARTGAVFGGEHRGRRDAQGTRHTERAGATLGEATPRPATRRGGCCAPARPRTTRRHRTRPPRRSWQAPEGGGTQKPATTGEDDDGNHARK